MSASAMGRHVGFVLVHCVDVIDARMRPGAEAWINAEDIAAYGDRWVIVRGQDLWKIDETADHIRSVLKVLWREPSPVGVG